MEENSEIESENDSESEAHCAMCECGRLRGSEVINEIEKNNDNEIEKNNDN
jgi:hypothetical protein